MLLNLWAALQGIVGLEAYAKALASLSPEDRQEITDAQAISWVRMQTSYKLVEAAALAAGRDPDTVYDESVRRSAQLTYRGVWKVLLRFASPDTLLTRASMMYSKSRNWGKLQAALLGEGSAELRITEWPQMPERYIRAIAISSATILEIAGQRKAAYTFVTTRDGAVIRMRWGKGLTPSP